MNIRPTSRLSRILVPVGLAVMATVHVTRASGYDNKENTANLLFIGEHVALSLLEGKLRVKGIYEFANTGSECWTGLVAYPIAVSGTQLPPRSVVAEDGDALPIDCRSKSRCYSRFAVTLEPGQSKRISVGYSQKLLANEAVYLLTSTHSWKSPLRWARYTVSIPSRWRDLRFSYSGNIRNLDENRKLFETVRTNFMPAEDLRIRWNLRRRASPDAPPDRIAVMENGGGE